MRPLPLQHSRHRHHSTQCMPMGERAWEASLLRMSGVYPCPCTAGLKLDPFNPDLKLELQKANQAVLKVGGGAYQSSSSAPLLALPMGAAGLQVGSLH